tara:strand:+ start:346 stop:513 length:168 start_codon:yes stop_codon:yes gene_type:complete
MVAKTQEKETDKKKAMQQQQIDATNPTLAEILKINSEETDESRKYTNAINTDYLD